jgi:hypothetical protein
LLLNDDCGDYIIQKNGGVAIFFWKRLNSRDLTDLGDIKLTLPTFEGDKDYGF